MKSDERHREILAIARRDGSVDVGRLSVHFRVAKETIRRDLGVLEDHGMVRRTHGGAYPLESAAFETTLADRSKTLRREKNEIAAAAIKLLGDAETVFIDEGFTPQLVAAALPRNRPLTVVTASLPVATAVGVAGNVSTILLGGRVRGGTSATVDHWATSMLAAFIVDLSFIGANGISRQHGLTTPDPAVRDVKAQAIRVSRRRVFIGVHTKFGATSFCRFAGVADFHAIVTDSGLPSSEAQRYSMLGPRVIRV